MTDSRGQGHGRSAARALWLRSFAVAGASVLTLVSLTLVGTARADESSTPEPSPTDSPSSEPSDTPSPSPTDTSSPTTSPPGDGGGGHHHDPGGPSNDPGDPSGGPQPGFDSPPKVGPNVGSGDRQDHKRKHDDAPKVDIGGRHFRIDVIHDSLESATRKARAATAVADEAAQLARRAARAERETQADLHDALKARAHASEAMSRAIRLINSSPVGNVIATDPTAAALIAAEETPDEYLEQGTSLTAVSESISTDLSAAEADLVALESAQVEALARQRETAEALDQARAAQKIAERAQRQARQVFFRVVGEGRPGTEEAFWISEFASSELGRMLADLHGGPRVKLGLARPNDGFITSPYGMRQHPILHTYKLHSGTDFSGGSSAITAAGSGEVVRAGYDVAYGNYVVIWHGHSAGRSVATLYAHCATLRVRQGQHVRVGQQIATVGATGYATGPHLHFEVRLAGRPVDPEAFLP